MHGRTNRICLAVVGVLLLAVGVPALLRSQGVLGTAHTAVTDQSVRSWVDARPWFWPAVTAVLVVIAILALWWLLTQLRRGTTRAVGVDAGPDGVTILPARALTQALRADLGESPHVKPGGVRLRGSRLDASVAVGARAEPAKIKGDVSQALRHFREASESQVTAVVKLH